MAANKPGFLYMCLYVRSQYEKLVNKINSSQTLAINRLKSIPQNATIRSEYIKCGKGGCNHHKTHGPYYYAYWKDAKSKKLKKKNQITIIAIMIINHIVIIYP
jgi:hypothetical protein